MGRIILNNEEYTGSGGGSGNVDDVEVNGVSVLDPSDKIAKITSYKEITRAEYEALPDTKLTDNIAYFITDGSSAKVQGYPPLIYSDEEREIGVWRDGKPLYQKTINLGRLTFNSNWHSVNHNISNVETIVNIKGILVSAVSPYYCYPIPAYRPSITQGVIVGGNSTEIQYINNWQSDDHTAYVTIQYTKTTDTAGSGIWNGQGGLAHHYSTLEKIIGTWINGKPLYEKVIDFGTLPNNSIKSIGTDVSNIGLVTKVDGFAYSSSATINIPYIEANSSTTKQTIDIWHNTSSNKVEVNANFNASSFYGFIVIQYTKTSD